MSIRQAPQGEESHSPSSPRFDPKQLPMLARLMTPVSADKVVTTGAAPVFLSESVPIRRSSVTSPQQLPPKSPKPARSSVLSNGPRPQLVAIGRSRSSSGSSNRPVTPSSSVQQTTTTTTMGEQPVPQAVLSSSCPVSRASGTLGTARTRMQHPYVNESSNWGLQQQHIQQQPQQPQQPPPQQPQQQNAPVTSSVPSGVVQVAPLSMSGNSGLTRSHPNLVNDYVNLDPKSCSGVNPDRCQPIAMSGTNTGLCPHRCTRLPHSDELVQVTAQLHSALARLSRLEVVDRELARMQEAHDCLVRSVERQHQLEAAVRRAFEREVAQLRQENGQLKDKLQHTILCFNLQQQQQQLQQQQISQHLTGQTVAGTRGAVSASGSSTACLDSDLLKLLIGEKESRISRLEQENHRLREQISSPTMGATLPTSSRETTPLSVLPSGGHVPSCSASVAQDAYNIDFLCDQLKMSMLSVVGGPPISAPANPSPPGGGSTATTAVAAAHVT